MTRKTKSQAERPYHHGNLPEVLAAAAEALVREKGAHGFTLRECARRAGVAHSAPGHHFGSVARLLTEVAARGFDRLTQRMQDERKGVSGPEALRRIGRAYVGFALSDPVIFVLMFHSDRVDRSVSRLQAAGEAAYGELVDAIALATGRRARDEDALRFAWATVHGIAMLLIDGRVKPGGVRHRGGDIAPAEGTIDRLVYAVTSYSANGRAKT
ncbi:MAG: TetR/AcrR family transcriptional regulator [Hyphomicrobiaceae bacterium]